MSGNSDYYDFMRGICELCHNTKCYTHKYSYEEHGQNAIDMKEKCIHMQQIKAILSNVKQYEVKE
jgi:hypothetical protein